MYEVWFKTIASTILAYDVQNQLVKTSVTFTYRNYATTAWSYLRLGFEVENVRNKKNRLEYRTNTTVLYNKTFR